MKKFGFTLAEVLITMTIIGVVTALTTPALFHNAQNAQIGPKLAKIRSTLESANQQLMREEEVGQMSTLFADITEAYHYSSSGTNSMTNDANAISQRYADLLSRHMRLEPNPEGSPTLFDKNDKTHHIKTYYGAIINNIRFFSLEGKGDLLVNLLNVKTPGYSTVEGMTIWLDVTGFVSAVVNGQEGAIYQGTDEGLILVDTNGIRMQPNCVGKDIFAFILRNDGRLVPYGDFTNTKSKLHWRNACNPNNDPPVKDTANTKQIAGLACTATIFNSNLKVTYDK